LTLDLVESPSLDVVMSIGRFARRAGLSIGALRHYAEPALHHGKRCLALAEEYELSPFDVGCGHEAIARAYAVAGATEDLDRHLALGYAVLDKIADGEERELLRSDLDSVL
jgi:hypothetical protein